MADTYVGSLPDGTVALTSWTLCEDSAGTVTFRVAVSDIVALVTNASQLSSGTLPFARIPTGSTSTTVCIGNDARLSDSRTPLAHKGSHATGQSDAIAPADIGAATSTHVHGNVTNDGKVGSTSGVPLITGAGGVITVGSFGTAAGTYCQGNDSRLSDSRNPTAHADLHAPNGSDPILPRSSQAAVSGTQDNYAVSGYDIIRVTSTGNVVLTGILASPRAPVLIVNENSSGGGTVTLSHESSSSTDINRVRSQTGSDIVLQPDGGQVWLWYSTTINRWRA